MAQCLIKHRDNFTFIRYFCTFHDTSTLDLIKNKWNTSGKQKLIFWVTSTVIKVSGINVIQISYLQYTFPVEKTKIMAARDLLRWLGDTLLSTKLALTTPTSGGQIKVTELLIYISILNYLLETSKSGYEDKCQVCTWSEFYYAILFNYEWEDFKVNQWLAIKCNISARMKHEDKTWYKIKITRISGTLRDYWDSMFWWQWLWRVSAIFWIRDCIVWQKFNNVSKEHR
jgi:hypothetical protein